MFSELRRRYLAEFQSAEDRKKSSNDALTAYTSASELANQDLPPTHPIRLGLALNFSVFYYEILNSPERACNLAKAVSGGTWRSYGSTRDNRGRPLFFSPWRKLLDEKKMGHTGQAGAQSASSTEHPLFGRDSDHVSLASFDSRYYHLLHPAALRHSTTRLRNSTLCQKNPTRTRPSSCSCSATT